MTGTVLQVSVSRGGIPKRAVAEGWLDFRGFDGDSCAHPAIHGTPDKAVLLMTAEAIDELIAQGYPLFHGALGENLTTRGLDRRLLRPGQRFRAGGAILELTRLRRPCRTIEIYGPAIQDAVFDQAARAGDLSSPKWGLSGFYASVVFPGFVRPGDPIALAEQLA